jgi:hypothetical protein
MIKGPVFNEYRAFFFKKTKIITARDMTSSPYPLISPSLPLNRLALKRKVGYNKNISIFMISQGQFWRA